MPSIEQYEVRTRKVSAITTQIAERCLAAGRAEEALPATDATDRGPVDSQSLDWADARMATHHTLGRDNEAQTERWSRFEHAISAAHLSVRLKRLPAFAATGATQRAFAHAPDCGRTHDTHEFPMSQPDLVLAAQLVTDHTREPNAYVYMILAPLPDARPGQHKLGPNLVLRAMIDLILAKSPTPRHQYAIEHYVGCVRLARPIADYGAFDTHDAHSTLQKSGP